MTIGWNFWAKLSMYSKNYFPQPQLTYFAIAPGGLHLNNDGTYMFASNLVDFLNGFLFNRNIWLTKDDNTNLGKENCKQGFDLSAKTKQSNKTDNLKLIATMLQAMKRR